MDRTIPLKAIAAERDGAHRWASRVEITWVWDSFEGDLVALEEEITEDEPVEDEPGHDGLGTPLHVECRRCGRSLGNYFVIRIGEFMTIVPRGQVGNWRHGRLLVRTDTSETIHYEWTCGCGVQGYRRADRLGDVPVLPDPKNATGWVLVL